MAGIYFVFGTAAVIYGANYLLPTVYLRQFCHHSKQSYQTEKIIMLTLDDGPDPRYTEQLLALLKTYDLKATFFVVAKKAADNEAVMHRIVQKGHAIGLHSLDHKCTWLHRKRYMKKDFQESIKLLDQIGCKPTYYRPPWGLISFSSYQLAKHYGLSVLFWDVMVHDWSKHTTSTQILKKLYNRTKNGYVICLHDSPEGLGAWKDALQNTIAALQSFIPKMLKEGYHFTFATSERSKEKYI